ncbi:hypothetical protein BDV96DRAFT_339103 [Lophiotrema nucula]|uniref:Uncharacterized protein n=1 Tax=Lophiotrema nucula TaxID=690887 RepID=A0A6A5YFW7_9PLEO|nr:hypothetical protein BDV96DRAFT_339103 [Lophiotrema nucula]
MRKSRHTVTKMKETVVLQHLQVQCARSCLLITGLAVALALHVDPTTIRASSLTPALSIRTHLPSNAKMHLFTTSSALVALLICASGTRAAPHPHGVKSTHPGENGPHNSWRIKRDVSPANMGGEPNQPELLHTDSNVSNLRAPATADAYSTTCNYTDYFVLNAWMIKIQPQDGQAQQDCGHSYLDVLRSTYCIVTGWKCNFTQGNGLALTFNSDKFCNAQKVEFAIFEGSEQAILNVPCGKFGSSDALEELVGGRNI